MRNEMISLCALGALAGICEQISGNGRFSRIVRFLLGLEMAICFAGWALELKEAMIEVIS